MIVKCLVVVIPPSPKRRREVVFLEPERRKLCTGGCLDRTCNLWWRFAISWKKLRE